MKLTCVRCGNTEFSGIDTSHPLTCPVPGCGWHFDPENPKRFVLRDSGDGGRATEEAQAWLDGWEEEIVND